MIQCVNQKESPVEALTTSIDDVLEVFGSEEPSE